MSFTGSPFRLVFRGAAGHVSPDRQARAAAALDLSFQRLAGDDQAGPRRCQCLWQAAGFCRHTYDFRGKIRKSCIRNAMSYRLLQASYEQLHY